MGTVQKIYDYFFYVIYRFWENAPSRWWSDWKAVITICLLTGFALLSIYGFVMYKFKLDLLPESATLPIIGSMSVYAFNHFYFLHKGKWKDKILMFEELNKKKDRFGIFCVIFVSLLIIVSLVCSIYLYSTVDWQNL